MGEARKKAACTYSVGMARARVFSTAKSGSQTITTCVLPAMAKLVSQEKHANEIIKRIWHGHMHTLILRAYLHDSRQNALAGRHVVLESLVGVVQKRAVDEEAVDHHGV